MEKRNYLRVTVTGVVTAISHMLLLPNPGFFIKIFQNKSLCIRVRVKEHFHWLTSLKIGVMYRFSKVVPMEINSGTDEAVQFVDASVESVVQEVHSVLPEPLQNICLAAVSCTGIVADNSLNDLGIYELRGGAKLCTAFIAHRVDMEPFKCLDSITVYNAHDRNVHGTKYYIMCAGSYAVSQQGYIPLSTKSSSVHPAIAFVLEKGWGFEDFLWLKEIFFKLKSLLDERLMLHDELNREYVFGMLNNLIFNDPASTESSVVRHTFMKEFFHSNHECAALAVPKHPDLEVLLINECRDLLISPKEMSEQFWMHKSHYMSNGGENSTKCVVIGKLSIGEEAPCLMLGDGVSLMRCVLVGTSDSCSKVKPYINKVVIVREAVIVVEEFRSSNTDNGASFEKEYVYMLLSPCNLHPICDSFKNETMSHVHSNECSTSQNMHASCSSKVLNVEESLLSQHVVIHHVSIPVIYNNKKQFYCLVSLLGHPMESGSSGGDSVVVEFKEKGRLCLLCMNKHMFQFYPFLFENRVYIIKYPRSYGVHLFEKRVNFPALATAAMFLPLTEGVTIPILSSISGPFISPNLPDDDLVNKEIYRIRDLQNVSFRDVVHVQGIVVFRSHQPAKYPRKRRLNEDHYGVPVERNIVVELRDEESDTAIRIYLIALAAKLYPLGLLPGSRVCIKFIEKRISARSKEFYQSTCFTSIRIIECPKGIPVSEREVSWDNSKRHSYIAKELEGSSFLQSPFWGILSISKIWKFEVVPLCRSCNFQIRFGRCSYVGCSNLLKDPLVTAAANFLVEDGSGEAFMSAKDENVRKLLGFLPSEWKELGAIASRNELSFDCRKYPQQSAKSSHATTKENVDQIVFNRLCSEVELKPWHILCQKFVDGDNEGTLRLFCLDVQEIDLTRAEDLCS